eukprot:14726770-Ditylum_brightwellii.AAC.1
MSVESSRIQTTRAWYWDPILNANDVRNTNPVGRQTNDASMADVIGGKIGSTNPMTSISK